MLCFVHLVCLLLCKEEGSSPVSAITERRDMDLYDVPMPMSLLGFGDIGGGRSFRTLWLPRSLVSESTACVGRFRRLSFLLAPSLGRTVELCLEWSLLLGSRSWLLSCDAMTDVVLIQTYHKELRREHI